MKNEFRSFFTSSLEKIIGMVNTAEAIIFLFFDIMNIKTSFSDKSTLERLLSVKND